MDKDIRAALDEIDEINPFATYLDDNALSKVTGWIDTGSYVLNAIVSGSIHGGIPKGRVTMMAGESMCLTANQKIRVYEMKTI
jgi:RecA/RadA recombinase